MAHHDTGRGERAMDEVILMEGGETLDDGEEGIGDLFLVEVYEVVAALAILDFGLEGGLLLEVKQSVVISYGSEQCGMGECAVRRLSRGSFEILVGLFGGLVEEEDVIGLEFDDDELLARGAHAAVEFILFIIFRLILIDLNADNKSYKGDSVLLWGVMEGNIEGGGGVG